MGKSDIQSKVIESDKDRFRHVDNKVVRAVNFYTNSDLQVDE